MTGWVEEKESKRNNRCGYDPIVHECGDVDLYNKYSQTAASIRISLEHSTAKGLNVINLYLDRRNHIEENMVEIGSPESTIATCHFYCI